MARSEATLEWFEMQADATLRLSFPTNQRPSTITRLGCFSIIFKLNNHLGTERLYKSGLPHCWFEDELRHAMAFSCGSTRFLWPWILALLVLSLREDAWW